MTIGHKFVPTQARWNQVDDRPDDQDGGRDGADEPDLDAPRRRWIGKIKGDDGVTRDYPIEQTKRANLQDLCAIMGGEDKVTGRINQS